MICDVCDLSVASVWCVERKGVESGRWVVILYLTFVCASVYINYDKKMKVGERYVVMCVNLVGRVYSIVVLLWWLGSLTPQNIRYCFRY